MAYQAIHTVAGQAAMAAAEAGGPPINLTHMAVGDGNGNPVEPTEDQTGLVRETFRDVINRIAQSPTEPNRFAVELIIPATAGGFTMREVGVFTADGTLFVVGNLPEAYKPQLSEGSFSDTVVRVEFEVTNAEDVTIVVDPNITVATREWVTNNVYGMPPGGTTGQVPMKASNADYDYVLSDLTDLNVVVETIEETQTLAALQTVVNLAVTNTNGLAVYVAGLRLRPDEWTPHPTIETRLTLSQAYPAGTKLVAAQNEPTGEAGAPLLRGSNLADVADKALGRQNLGVLSVAESNSAGNAGDIKYTARNVAPVGWLKANGAAVSRTTYASLFAAIGTTFGAGNGFDTFNLPDLRGEFVRGWDDGRGVDTGRAIGSAQGDANKSHAHNATTASSGSHTHGATVTDSGPDSFTWVGGRGPGDTATNNLAQAGTHKHTVNIQNAGSHSHGVTVQPDGSYESRPRNVALLAVIKY